MVTFNCTSVRRACVKSTNLYIFILYVNKKLEISAYDIDFSFFIFMGLKTLERYLKRVNCQIMKNRTGHHDFLWISDNVLILF